ncbi:hypothetical protein [Oceanobacillus sp. J11TS1]|uniref:hypothetical protein n=1 Tax=Oceanobacillus sp. J11TS1 TaxID=2807191 RepID=UPI001B297F6B|nr:hypothetical protein [Oceanobacillus sp. J11TS1]GIO23768.1 hypothetical protein J11TS1_23490 [Oceanobacillus sp. J11TS1]
MLKDEFKGADKLKTELNQFHVTVPEQKLRQKQTTWQRFIRYLASPAQDPFEKTTVTTAGLNLTRIIPLACGVGISIVSLVIYT